MEQSYDNSNHRVAAPPAQSPRPVESTTPRFNGNPASNARHFGGIHLRRDKRFPLSNRVTPDMIEAASAIAPTTAAPTEPDALQSWKEAVMLWLSWNSTYEKVTAKMCKPGYDQKKIEALMDEMDGLRKRAIDLSEGLLKS